MRTVLIPLVVLMCACPKKSEDAPKTAAPPPATVVKPPPKTAEVEFFGEWKAGGVKAAKVIFVAQAEPCTPVPEKATRDGEQNLHAEGNRIVQRLNGQPSAVVLDIDSTRALSQGVLALELYSQGEEKRVIQFQRLRLRRF